MPSIYNIPLIYLLLNIITGCLSLSLAILLIVFRGPEIFKPASKLMFLFWFWLITELLEYFSIIIDNKFIFNKLQFLSTSLLPVVWFSFCYQIRMGYSLFNKKINYLVYLYPLCQIILVYTNPYHHLLWDKPRYIEGNFGIVKVMNPLFGILLMFAFLIIISGIVILVVKPNKNLIKSGKSRWIVVFMGVLTIITAFYEWKTDYRLQFELAPLTLSLVGLSGLLYIQNSIRSQILLNKYNVLSTLKEPLFLVKEDGLILFANDSAARLSDIRESQFYTERIETFIPALGKLAEGVIFHNHLFFSVNINPVLKDKEKIYTVSLTEVTALKDSEISLKHLSDELENQVRNRTESLNQSNLKLEKLLEEKNILLQEVHHRVNNNLQLIISLLNLQSSRVIGDEIRIYLKDAVARVQTIAMVHQMLYKSEDFSRINLKDYLEDLIFSMLKEQQEHVDLDFCDIICSTTTCIQVGMIMNEIILNALKYAYDLDNDKKRFLSKTWVEKKKEETDRLNIIFRDFGRGIPEDLLKSKEKDSLGFRIIKTLVDQRNGELKIYNDKGCVYELSVEI